MLAPGFSAAALVVLIGSIALADTTPLTLRQLNSLQQAGVTASSVSPLYGQVLMGTDGTTLRIVKTDSTGQIGFAGFPTSAALADSTVNPTTTLIGSMLMGWNQSTNLWDRVVSETDNGDAQGTSNTGHLSSMSHLLLFNGTSWDRSRDDANKNLLVSLGTQLDAVNDSVSIRINNTIPGISAAAATGAEQGVVVRNVPVPASLVATGVGASGAGVTITLSAVASQFHYITGIQIQMYAVAALTGGATPVQCTTTNIPNTPVTDFPTAAAIGTMVTSNVFQSSSLPVKSTTVNTNTTVVCPATTNVIWVVTATYYAAP